MDLQEVADFLGCTVRTVKNYRKEGRLSVKYEKQAGGRGSPKAIFNREEVINLNEDLSASRYAPIPEVIESIQSIPTSSLVEPAQITRLEKAVEAFTRLQQITAINQKLTLSIAESAMLSGFPVSGIKRLVKEKKIPAFKVGRAWIIKRSDLEKFIAQMGADN